MRKIKRRCKCGCGKITNPGRKYIRHHYNGGAFKHGKTGIPEYKIWSGMKQRCYNKKQAKYNHYGGRGITVCKRWRESFTAFLEDMGPRPSPEHSIDRIKGHGNYTPKNCRWATRSEQRVNRVSETKPIWEGYIY